MIPVTETFLENASGSRVYMPVAEFGSVRIEPSERWVRAKFGGHFVANSRNTLLVWDHHVLPVYFFPGEDVATEYLTLASDASDGRIRYDLTVGAAEARHAAWSFTDPDEEHGPLKDYVAFKWNMMDAWYEEATEVFVHPRDPHKRVDAIPSSRHVVIELDGQTIADTKRPTILFETGLPPRYYVPAEDVNMALLTRSDTKSQCPYKGTANYCSIQAGDVLHEDLVWTYPEPIPQAPNIKDLMAFFNEKLDITVDGKPEERPITPWS